MNTDSVYEQVLGPATETSQDHGKSKRGLFQRLTLCVALALDGLEDLSNS
jgi:hypothetical protein